MADKKITDVDFLNSLSGNESFFINYNNTLKQINTGDMVFDIENGGTGASTAAKARQNINFIGRNPIANLEEDTTATWAAFGTGVALIDANGIITNKPNVAGGFIFNQVVDNLVYQVWYGMVGSTMPVHYRAGNSSGWYAGSANWTKGLTENNGIQKVKLWENSSPAATFAPQTLTIDLSGYDRVELTYRHNSKTLSVEVDIDDSTIFNGTGNISNTGSYPRLYSRIVTVNIANIIFEDCYCTQTNQTDTLGKQNGYCIPYQIYGIKGVQ